MNIILTGFMGTGKTAVGKRLARRLGWRFVDVDALIEATAGCTVADVFAARGEPVFRRLERRCVARVLRDNRQVIATGGGAFVDPALRSRLKASGPVICLSAKPETILARVKHRLSARPLLGGAGSALARIKSLLGARSEAYAQADATIDTTGLDIDATVERIRDALSPHLCRSWEYLLDHADELARRFGGRYIVVAEDRIVASGGTQLEAYQRSRQPKRIRVRPPCRPKTLRGETGIYYIPRPEESATAL
ncbi:MAG TPA: shikimate kinase [bacterium]